MAWLIRRPNLVFADPIRHGSKQIHLEFLERHAFGT
jgi:hypothetical protein